MTAKLRGKAIILDNHNFQHKCQERKGSGLDVVRLEVVFKKLGFEVEVWKNLTAAVSLAFFFSPGYWILVVHSHIIRQHQIIFILFEVGACVVHFECELS